MGVLRENQSPEEIIGFLAFHAGIIDRPEAVKASELINAFSWEKVPRENIIVSCSSFF